MFGTIQLNRKMLVLKQYEETIIGGESHCAKVQILWSVEYSFLQNSLNKFDEQNLSP